jgi:cupin 2 domain-containing protein
MKNLLKNIPKNLPDELFQTLIQTYSILIEQIISKGHTSSKQGWQD